MWLFNSSVGRKVKVVMSVTGIALILFLTFHCCMNIVALFSGEAYNMICELLGANWYAVVATLGLAALAVAHIVYAFILTAQNRRARGAERYAVTDKPAKVEWASQNMLVLGIIVVLGLLLHLFNFWYNMMFTVPCGRPLGQSCRRIRLHHSDVLLLGLCGALHHLARGTVVPPHSRLLVGYADTGCQRQDLVLPLEGDW